MALRINELRATDASCPKFSLAGESRHGLVVDAYDGDTCRVNLFMQPTDSRPYQMAVRLLGYDTAELKSKDLGEKHKAMLARTALRSILRGRIARLEIEGLDKYGRLLARVYVRRVDTGDELCVNDWMMDSRLAVAYGGGGKGNVMANGNGSDAPEAPPTQDIVA